MDHSPQVRVTLSWCPVLPTPGPLGFLPGGSRYNYLLTTLTTTLVTYIMVVTVYLAMVRVQKLVLTRSRSTITRLLH